MNSTNAVKILLYAYILFSFCLDFLPFMCVHVLGMWDNMKNLFDLKAVSSVSIPKYIDLEERISLLILLTK